MVTVARTALVLVTALMLQVSLVARFSLNGARGDLLLLIALSAAVAHGPEKGAIVGFAAGLTFDLVLRTPFGLSALVYCVAAFAVGTVQVSVLRVTRWLPAASIAAGSVLAIVLYVMGGALIGRSTLTGTPLTTIIFVVAGLNALLSPLSTRLMRWSLTDTSERSFTLR